MARVVVTGGGGFIGSNLVHALVARGDSVAVVDDFSTGRKVNLAALTGRIEVFEGDIRDRALLKRALNGAQYVLHQAALPSVARSMEAPEDTHDVNVNGTLYVLQAARAAGVQRLVFAASSSAYGETPVLPKVETMAPCPISPYGASKQFGETYCQIWTQCFGLQCVALRYFNVFGPRQSPDSEYAAVIPRFVTLMQQGRRPTVFGDGGQTRDFCYIDNVVEANLKALTAPNAPGNIYNVACGERISLLDLIAEINRQLGTAVPVEHLPPRAGDIRDSLADISAIRRDLGYTVSVSFADGLQRAISWYAAHPRG